MINISFFVVLIVFAGLFFLLLFLSDYKRRLSRVEFIKLSKKLNLNCDAPDGFLAKFPELNGTYKNFPVRIFMFTENVGSGKSRVVRVHTGIEIKINNPIGYKLDLYEEGFFSKLYKVFGMQDIVIGNEKFDKEYIIKSNNEQITREILTKSICDELLYMADHKFAFGFEIKDNKIYYDEPSSLTSERKAIWLERILNMLIELAVEVEKRAGLKL
jgi:hypothetical protein